MAPEAQTTTTPKGDPISGADVLREAATLVAMHLRNRLPRIPADDPDRAEIEAKIAELTAAA
jgi:hypothetical protein